MASVTGPTDGPPVVLLHGSGQTRHSWTRAAQELADGGFLVVNVDVRGHGDSDWAGDGTYPMQVMVEDLCTVVDQLDAPPAVVGASIGGVIAMLATEHRQLRGLVLVDIAPRIEAAGAERIRTFMIDTIDGFDSLDDAAAAVAAYRGRARPANPTGLVKNLRHDPDGRYRWRWDPAIIHFPPMASLGPGELHRRAAAIAIPTLLVRGRSSDVVIEEAALEFLELVPSAEVVDVSGAGHMVAGDRNDAVADEVIGFLRRLGSS